jgi:hypothetical protein
MSMEVEWRPAVGWEGYYEVSDTGLVRSVPRSVIRRDGRKYPIRGKLMTPFRNSSGYPAVHLRDEARHRSAQTLIHRMVAEAFVLNPENKPFVNHIDGNRSNASASNLEWVTSGENHEHAWKSGSMEKHRAHVVLTNELVKQARDLWLHEGCSMGALSRKFGVCPSTLGRAIRGKTWAHVPGAVQEPNMELQPSLEMDALLNDAYSHWQSLEAAASRANMLYKRLSALKTLPPLPEPTDAP